MRRACPKGVFNLINGDGPGVGGPLSSHPDVDMVSFTGSTRAGTEVARSGRGRRSSACIRSSAASRRTCSSTMPTSRVPSKQSVLHVFQNSGQSCNAPTRMLVPRAKLAEVEAIAQARRRGGGGRRSRLGEDHTWARWCRKIQFERVQGYIAQGHRGGRQARDRRRRPAGRPRQGLLREARPSSRT